MLLLMEHWSSSEGIMHAHNYYSLPLCCWFLILRQVYQMMKTLISSLTTSLFQQSASRNAAQVTQEPALHKDYRKCICSLATLANVKCATVKLTPEF